MTSEKVRLQELEQFPFGVALPFREAFRACRYLIYYYKKESLIINNYYRNGPPDNWPVEAYILIGREDLAHQAGTLFFLSFFLFPSFIIYFFIIEIKQKTPAGALTTEAPPRASDITSSSISSVSPSPSSSNNPPNNNTTDPSSSTVASDGCEMTGTQSIII